MNTDAIDIPTGREVVVSGQLPSAPLVLVDDTFVAHLNDTESISKTLIVRDEATQNRAAAILNELTKAATQIEKARKTLKQPFIDFGKKIDEAANQVGSRIDNLKSLLGGKLTAFRLEEEKKARELERARQEELRRLEAERKREEDARLKREEEEAARVRAAQPKTEELSFDMPAPAVPTEIEQKIAQVQAAPAVVVAKPQGARWLVALKFRVMDVSCLPKEYTTREANLPKIRGLTAGWKEGQPLPVVPGVEFYEDRQFVGTGR